MQLDNQEIVPYQAREIDLSIIEKNIVRLVDVENIPSVEVPRAGKF